MVNSETLKIRINKELKAKLKNLKRKNKIEDMSNFTKKAIEAYLFQTIQLEKQTIERLYSSKGRNESVESYLNRLMDLEERRQKDG